MMRWMGRLLFFGLGAALISYLWSRMNEDFDDDDLDDEISLDFDLPEGDNSGMGDTGSLALVADADTGDGPGAALAAPPTEEMREDDLTVIRGIGPVFQKRLHSIGIYTYQDLAASTPAELEAKGISGVGVDQADWIAQAGSLQKGGGV